MSPFGNSLCSWAFFFSVRITSVKWCVYTARHWWKSTSQNQTWQIPKLRFDNWWETVSVFNFELKFNFFSKEKFTRYGWADEFNALFTQYDVIAIFFIAINVLYGTPCKCSHGAIATMALLAINTPSEQSFSRFTDGSDALKNTGKSSTPFKKKIWRT